MLIMYSPLPQPPLQNSEETEQPRYSELKTQLLCCQTAWILVNNLFIHAPLSYSWPVYKGGHQETFHFTWFIASIIATMIHKSSSRD